MLRFSRKARLRAGLFGLACGALAAPAGCGTVLGLDGIEYDVVADAARGDVSQDGGGAGPSPDGSSPIDGSILVDAGPRPDGPFTLAQGLGLPQALAVDQARLYWISAQGTGGSVESMLKDGSGPVETFATNQPFPLDIAVDGTNVYWSVNQTPPPAQTLQCLAMVASKDGGAAACATSGAFASIRMTLAGPYILVLSQAGANDFIGFAMPDGGYENVQASGPSLAVTSGGAKIFLGNASGFHVDELSLPALGYGPIACLTDCGGSPIADMATDVTASNLLWITQAGGVFSLPTSGTPTNGAQLAQLSSTPQRMTRDSSYVYVTTSGSVLAVPLARTDAGPPTVTLASGEASPFGIAVDADYVYWTDSDGTIRATRVPPPP